jgi:hypothetical protein
MICTIIIVIILVSFLASYLGLKVSLTKFILQKIRDIQWLYDCINS